MIASRSRKALFCPLGLGLFIAQARRHLVRIWQNALYPIPYRVVYQVGPKGRHVAQTNGLLLVPLAVVVLIVVVPGVANIGIPAFGTL
jgi:hypothetical protein